ncbi:LysR substrate-binding domain-containing protein [Gemmobacter lanyuensis]
MRFFTGNGSRSASRSGCRICARDTRGAGPDLGGLAQSAGQSAGGTLTLAVLPTFAARWLTPRLPGFLAAYPGVTINLISRLTSFDFKNEAIDAAIHFGTEDWPGRNWCSCVMKRCARSARRGCAIITAFADRLMCARRHCCT